MCELNCDNLIDLSLDNEASGYNPQKSLIGSGGGVQLPTYNKQNETPPWRICDNIENNPFDCVQELADRLIDPFDVLEKEACLKGEQASKNTNRVKIGNLLSLSDNNLFQDDQLLNNPTLRADFNDTKAQEQYFESPPFACNKNPPGSISETDTDSTPNSSIETSNSSKLRKILEQRKRLLKLSISNAALSSPTFRKQSKETEELFGTPVSSIFSKAAEFGESLLSAESPLKLVEDEDVLSEESQTLLDLEKKFEADLEMLKIPILNELPSTVEQSSIKSVDSTSDKPNIQSHKINNTLPNLEAIKSKLNEKRSENSIKNYQKEISSLVGNLKSLITRDDMVGKSKKQACDLMESLTAALCSSKIEQQPKNPEVLSVPPIAIGRQNTFDLDLQKEIEPNIDGKQISQEIPSCMTSSSATYDGETPMEKHDLDLPEITPLSPTLPPSPARATNNIPSDVNDIIEHLGKLLTADNQINSNNPTFIVVLNTNQLNTSSVDNYDQNEDAKIKSSFVASCLENSINGSSPEFSNFDIIPRRRSQSLSTHDKIKIVQLPIQPNAVRPIQKQHSMQRQETSAITTTPPSNGKDISEFKTPARLRRNSYSSGTPYTAQVGLRRTGFATDAKNLSQMRKLQTLDTHHEGQQQAIVRPLTNNFPTFKPDLKKKAKHNTESIMKASGPLKATIPVKKVAPMLKTSPPTPERNTKSKLSLTPVTPIPAKRGLRVGYPNACSTPAASTSPLKRTSGPLNKPRYSYMSATPNPKSSVNNSSTTSLKRRTIVELKAKSPLKPRLNNAGLKSAVASPSKTLAGSSRLSISAGARTSKTPVKTAANTATVKPTRHINTRVAAGGSSLSSKNKENKRH